MLRKALISDVTEIHELLQFYGNTGELLARPLSRLYDHLRDFWVFEDKETQRILGCCALQFCWEDLAEIRSLAVREDASGQGIGTMLVDRCVHEAIVFKIPRLFVLTYRPDFFERFEFRVIERSELPIKIWSDCLACVHFPDCNETAMERRLYPDIS